MTFDKWVTFTAVRSRCVWRGGVAEQMLSGQLMAIAQLEMGYNATVSLAVHACQRAQSVASPERRENARHLDLFHARVLGGAVVKLGRSRNHTTRIPTCAQELGIADARTGGRISSRICCINIRELIPEPNVAY